MIVQRDRFIEDFVAWVGRKLEKSLAEEDFELEYLKQAIKILNDHKDCYKT